MKKLKELLKLDKTKMNFAYGMGAAIVIIGALMKITHSDLDLIFYEISGNDMLTVGLITEAIILLFQHLISLEKNISGKMLFLNYLTPTRKEKKNHQVVVA